MSLEPARAAARRDGVVVIGAGQAGGRAVEALRAQGFAGHVTLIGDEDELPYERPSLSKEMLHGHAEEQIAWVQKPEFYAAKNITLRPATRAVAIDRAARRVALANGETLHYGALILATGARVRELQVPGADASICHYLRTLADSRALRARLIGGARVVVIGAGFIGLEAAAAAVRRGCDVTVIEAGALPLGRVAPAQIGAYYRDLHAAEGVKFIFNARLEEIRRSGEALEISVGTDTVRADMLIVGIGVIPNAELAAEAGLAVERGIVVDEYGMTTDPCIFAAGDVARHFNPIFGRHILLESWQNAQNQAIAIAKNLSSEGAATPYAELPWFWSDQYDVNLQMFGLAEPGGSFVTRGDPAQRSWMLFQLQDDRMTCAIGINAARELRAARELISLGAPVRPEILAEPGLGLAELARREKRARMLVQ